MPYLANHTQLPIWGLLLMSTSIIAMTSGVLGWNEETPNIDPCPGTVGGLEYGNSNWTLDCFRCTAPSAHPWNVEDDAPEAGATESCVWCAGRCTTNATSSCYGEVFASSPNECPGLGAVFGESLSHDMGLSPGSVSGATPVLPNGPNVVDFGWNPSLDVYGGAPLDILPVNSSVKWSRSDLEMEACLACMGGGLTAGMAGYGAPGALTAAAAAAVASPMGLCAASPMFGPSHNESVGWSGVEVGDLSAPAAPLETWLSSCQAVGPFDNGYAAPGQGITADARLPTSFGTQAPPDAWGWNDPDSYAIDTDCSPPDAETNLPDWSSTTTGRQRRLWLRNSPELCAAYTWYDVSTEGDAAAQPAQGGDGVAYGEPQIVDDLADPYYSPAYMHGFVTSPKRVPCEPGTYHVNAAHVEDLNSASAGVKDACEPCPEGTFSFWGFSQCYPCPTETVLDGRQAVQCANGTLEALPGFWCESPFIPTVNPTPRASDNYYNDIVEAFDGGKWVHAGINKWSMGVDADRRMGINIQACVGANPDARCGGGSCCYDVPYGRCPACEEGYAGSLCASCAEGHYELSNSCWACPAIRSEVTIVIGVLAFIALVYIVFRLPGVSAGFFRLSLDFFQVTALLPQFSVPWPPIFLSIVSFFELSNLDLSITAPECSLESFRDPKTRFLVTIVTPIALVVVFFTVVIIRRAYRKLLRMTLPPDSAAERLHVDQSWRIVNLGLRAFVTFFAVAYLFLAVKSLSILDCRAVETLDDQNRIDAIPVNQRPWFTISDMYWEAVPSSLCWGARKPGEEDVPSTWEQVAPYAFFGIVMYAVFIPVLIRSLLRRNHARLSSPTVTARLGTLFALYSPALYDWEFWGMVRKLVLAMLALFWSGNPRVQLTLGTAVIGLFLYWAVKLKPYLYRIHNALHITLLSVQGSMFVIGSLFAWGVVVAPGQPGHNPAVYTLLEWLLILGLLFGFLNMVRVARRELAFRAGVAKEVAARYVDAEERRHEAEQVFPHMQFTYEGLVGHDEQVVIAVDALKKHRVDEWVARGWVHADDRETVLELHRVLPEDPEDSPDDGDADLATSIDGSIVTGVGAEGPDTDAPPAYVSEPGSGAATPSSPDGAEVVMELVVIAADEPRRRGAGAGDEEDDLPPLAPPPPLSRADSKFTWHTGKSSAPTDGDSGPPELPQAPGSPPALSRDDSKLIWHHGQSSSDPIPDSEESEKTSGEGGGPPI